MTGNSLFSWKMLGFRETPQTLEKKAIKMATLIDILTTSVYLLIISALFALGKDFSRARRKKISLEKALKLKSEKSVT